MKTTEPQYKSSTQVDDFEHEMQVVSIPGTSLWTVLAMNIQRQQRWYPADEFGKLMTWPCAADAVEWLNGSELPMMWAYWPLQSRANVENS